MHNFLPQYKRIEQSPRSFADRRCAQLANQQSALRCLATAAVVLLLTACGGLASQDFASAKPRFEPEKFFAGATRSWGVIEDRFGNPTSRFRTETRGRRDANALHIDQRFFFEDGRTQWRVWRLRRIDAHRYAATANDVIGTATGEARGNAFRWEYTVRLNPDNPLSNVRFHHWMYLLDDGATMMNRVIVSKLGVTVAEVTEYFRRGAGRVPAIKDIAESTNTD